MQLMFNFDEIKKDKPKLEIGKWLTPEEVEKHKGKLIRFRDLEKYIGQVVISESKTVSLTSYKPVKILKYWHDCNHMYSHDDEGNEIKKPYDKAGYSDNPRRPDKVNAWPSEPWSYGDRHPDDFSDFMTGFYEII